MIKARNADVTRVSYGGTMYSIYDAYPTKAGAERAARDIRTKTGRVHMPNYTKAVVVDLGKDAGRFARIVKVPTGGGKYYYSVYVRLLK